MTLAFRRFCTAVWIFSLVAAILMATPRPVQAGNTITVNTFDDKYGNSNSCSLRDAITAANEDVYFAGCEKGSGADTIVLKAGTYKLTKAGSGDSLPGSGDLDITSDLTIIGLGSQGPNGTSIAATGLGDRAIHIRPTSGSITVKLSNLSISGGASAADNGGAISNDTDPAHLNDHASLQLDNVVITGNQSGTISATGLGGGIYNGPGCTLSISRSTISNNQSSYGGGIFNYGTLAITNSTITGNSAWKLGGGMDSRPQKTTDQVSITSSTISANTIVNNPQETGGMTSSGRLIVQNSSFTANSGAGLKISGSGSVATISSTTFTNINGIGVSLLIGASATITDSSFVQNTTGLIVAGGATAIVSTTTFRGNTQVNVASAAGIDSAGILNLQSSSVIDNTGSGIFLKNGGTTTITSVLVNGNGGVGVRVDDGATATVINTSVTSNTAVELDSGSGIASTGSLTLQNSTVSGNTGIGLKVNSSALPDVFTQVINSTIAANTAQNQAEGMGISTAGVLHLLYVTLADNSGTGLVLEDGSRTNVQNTIIERHGISNCTIHGTATLTSEGHNLFYNFPLPAAGTCSFNGTGDVEVLEDNDPLSKQLIYNGGPTKTYAIASPASPAVDAVPVTAEGIDYQCPAANQVDQRWLARPVDGNNDSVNGCDIGAYEFGAPFYIQYVPSISR